MRQTFKLDAKIVQQIFGIVFGSEMSGKEVTIKFEGYNHNTATYVVLTNEEDEVIEEITEDGQDMQTEEIEIQPVYDSDTDPLLLNGQHTSAMNRIDSDAEIQIVTAPSGK